MLSPVLKHGFLRSEENVNLNNNLNIKVNIFFRPEEAMLENWQKLVFY